MRNKLNHLMVMFLLTGSITSVFGSNSVQEKYRYKLGHYASMIASKYFNNIDDFINLELSTPAMMGNTRRFRFNPVSIKPKHLDFFTSLETLHLYDKKDIAIWRQYRFPKEKKLFHAIEIHPNIKYTDAKTLLNDISNLTKDNNIIFHDISYDNKFFIECIEFNINNGALNFKDITYNKKSIGVRYILKRIDRKFFPDYINNGYILSNGRYDYKFQDINSIVIPTSVHTISDCAFNSAKRLSTVVIPNSVTHIENIFYRGWYEFNNQSNITIYTDNIYAANRFKTDSFQTFTSIHNIKDAPDDIFSNKSRYVQENNYPQIINSLFVKVDTLNLENSKFPPIIPFKGFKDNTTLTSITLNNIFGICNSAFESCKALKSVVIPSTITKISNAAFKNCEQLSAVELHDGLKVLDNECFNWCRNLMNILIPTTVEVIGNKTFASAGLESINLPNSITYIGEGAFESVKLTNVVIPNKISSIANKMFLMCSNLISVFIPTTVTSIGVSVFEGCSSLSNINIPYNIVKLGKSCFSGCALASFTIPTGITKIAYKLFASCGNLTSIDIHTNVKRLSTSVFHGCSKLSEVNIPSSITYIGGFLFSNCSSLTNVVIHDSVEYIDTSCLFSSCVNLKNVVLPTSTSKIGWFSFYNCSSLTSVNIPENVSIIDRSAFESCKSLTSITLPQAITRIDEGAFEECVNLKEITLPDNIEKIDVNTFAYCSNLSSINIPSEVTSIKNCAFKNCKGLIKLDIGSQVRSIGSYYKSVPLDQAQYGRTVIRGNETFAGCNNCTFTVHNNRLKSLLLRDGILEQQIVKTEDYVENASASEDRIYVITEEISEIDGCSGFY